MSRDFLFYWKPSQAQEEQGSLLTSAGSNQFYRVHREDTVWMTTRNSHGDLILIGRVRVEECTDYAGARKRFPTKNVFPSQYQIIAKPETVERLREVDISNIAGDLRFASKKNRLKVTDGQVDAKQLQSMRELTPESARILEEKWSGSQ